MIDPALQGFNPYSYVNNRPHHFTDPSGEIFGIDDFPIGLAVSAIIGAVVGAAAGGIQYAVTKEGSLGMSIGLGALAGAVGGAVSFGVGTGITTGLAWTGIYAGQGSAVLGDRKSTRLNSS